MKVRELEQELLTGLQTLFERSEAEAIATIVSEAFIGKSALKTDDVDEEVVMLSRAALTRLLKHEPVQYILQQAWFCDLKFKVNSDVLIPRPETEEMVYNINRHLKKEHCRILDIGTGSGCIAIALKKMNPTATVTGIDISEKAIDLARMNALRLKLAVNFHQMDIFDHSSHTDFIHTYEKFDVIVSNPPYIPLSEKEKMSRNVTAFEPHIALFVDDEDALVFYRKIADFADTFLNSSGKLFFEVHYDKMKDVVSLLTEKNFSDVKGVKDMSGNDRFVEAMK
jgi:release factor glutamine methyltransferase